MDNKTCKHCGVELIIKQTKRTPEQLLKSYYYSAYYSCPRCGRMYLNDEFKVVNKNFDLFTGETVNGEPVDVEIWTDGACTNNGRENAKAAWAFVSGEFEKAGQVDGKQTNNRAEAQAIYEALRWAVQKGHHRIKIYSDSQITLQGLQKPLDKIIANTDIFGRIFSLITNADLHIEYEKVLGHSGIENNERVDKLANNLAQNSQ